MHKMCRLLVAGAFFFCAGIVCSAEPSGATVGRSAAPSYDSAAADVASKATRPDLSKLAPSPSPLDSVSPDALVLIRGLDSPSFELRQQALAGLERLACRPEQAAALAIYCQKLALDEATSLEARTCLEQLLRYVPAQPERLAPSGPEISAVEIDRLLLSLDDDAFGARSAAAARLEWLAQNPVLVCRLLSAVHQRLAELGLSDEQRAELQPVWTRIHGLWLLSDSARWQLPPVSQQQIGALVEQLADPAPKGHDDYWPPHELARQELLDLLVRSDTCGTTTRALAARLADPKLDPLDAERLQAVLDWTRPALVAEYWEGKRNLGVQHLIVGVPSLPAGSQTPSDFDRIDDRTAHCASGNSLSPGDYPVGIAFPHPRQPGAFFHLVNLPTAQRRLAYEYLNSEQSEAERLAEISARTLAEFLAAGHPLDDEQMSLLDQLDAASVSRFAGTYLRTVADTSRDDSEGPFGPLSRHGLLCLWLALHGTPEALPGLTAAAERHVMAEPDGGHPFRLPWVAALAIAARTSTPETDVWLAAQLRRAELLEVGATGDVGATAAALLVAHQSRTPRDFGLAGLESEPLERLNLQPFRFLDGGDRQSVAQWWAEKRSAVGSRQ